MLGDRRSSRIDPTLGLGAVLLALFALPGQLRKSKAQRRREETGTEKIAVAVRPSEPSDDIDARARELQSLHWVLNRTLPGNRKRCVNIKKLRNRLRLSQRDGATADLEKDLDKQMYDAA